MKGKIRIIFNIMTFKAKRNIKDVYGADFYYAFKKKSKRFLEEMLPDAPNIGKSIFSINYNYGPCYFAWYRAFREQGISKVESLKLIWQINED